MTSAAQAYLALPADERFETRISTTLVAWLEGVPSIHELGALGYCRPPRRSRTGEDRL